MKMYLITEGDCEALLTSIDRDPSYGQQGGSSDVLSDDERRAHEKAHRFLNYQVRCWLDKIKR